MQKQTVYMNSGIGFQFLLSIVTLIIKVNVLDKSGGAAKTPVLPFIWMEEVRFSCGCFGHRDAALDCGPESWDRLNFWRSAIWCHCGWRLWWPITTEDQTDQSCKTLPWGKRKMLLGGGEDISLRLITLKVKFEFASLLNIKKDERKRDRERQRESSSEERECW